jgi:uncharacterized membrane protein
MKKNFIFIFLFKNKEMSTLNANHDILIKRRRKTRLTTLKENREIAEIRAIEKEAENEQTQISMREELQQNLLRIKLLYIEKQKELAKKQEVARQRKIEAEYNERKRFFIENRRLVREQQRKKIIDAARYHCCFIICIILTIFKLIKNKLRKKAEQLIESNEAHLLKSIN